MLNKHTLNVHEINNEILTYKFVSLIQLSQSIPLYQATYIL